MFSIPLSVLLLVYLVFIVIFFIFFFLNIYHLNHASSLTIVSFFVTVIILGSGLLVITATWSLLLEVDWRAPIITIDTANFFRLKNNW